MNKKLQSIGADAFKNSGLKEFKVQSSITSMGKRDTLVSDGSGKEEYTDTVFHDCAKLEKLDFSEQSSFLGQTIQNCISLKEVILPQPLTSIPDNQFRNCQSLSYVSYKNGEAVVNKFPSTLKKIGQYAFYSCAFTDLLMDDCSKVAIGQYAFAANAFETLNVPSGNVSDVGAYAFSSSPNLKTVNWQNEFNVPEYCFAYSRNLQTFNTISIKDGISGYAFAECSKLSAVDLQINGADFVIAEGAFKNCAISDMIFPEGLSSIGSQAFYGNLFQTMVFPSTLAYLAEDSLQNCYNLEKFTLNNDLSSTITNLKKVGKGPTWYVEGEPYLVGTERSSAPDGIGPKNTYTIYPGSASHVDWEWIEVISDTQIKRYTTSTDSNGNKTTISTVENKTYAGTEIGKKYMTKYNPESMKSGAVDIVVPTAVIDYVGNVHDIEGIVSFDTNDVVTQKLASGDTVRLELMSGLTYIGADCFNNANGKKLAGFSVSMTINYVGANAFNGTNISSVYLPNLTFIGEGTFANCSNLTSAELSNFITEIPDSCFQNSGLTNFVVPQYLQKIGTSAFAATKLTKIYLPSTVIEIGTSAFADCDKLSSVEGLSNIKITEVKSQTFNRCSSLNKVYLPSTVKTIGVWAFNACSNLTYLTFGSALEEIATYAFSYCDKLSSLEFPITLTSIGENAFVGCSALTKLNFSHSSFANLSVGASAFGETTSSLKVYIKNVIALDDYKQIFDGTETDKGFAEDATLFYQNETNPLAFYKSKEWKAVRTISVYCGEGGSATIIFGTDPGILIQSSQQKTFNIIDGTDYTINITESKGVDLIGLFVNNVNKIDKIIDNKTYKTYSDSIIEDCSIVITFDAQLVILDENGGDAAHELDTSDKKDKFTIREDGNEYTKNGKPFYFYSSISSDNEIKQDGKRFDVGVEYPVTAIIGIKVLYAIYLTPTADDNFALTTDGVISLKSGVSVSNLVIPKSINGVKVTGIAARGFSNAAESGQITDNSKVSGLITMPSTVTSIGKRAFAGNSGINSRFSFPYALKELGDEAFALCKFPSININIMCPNSNVVKFENSILYTTGGAYQLALGAKTTSIENIDATTILPHAFAGNKSLEIYNDASKITKYGDYAFAGCDSTKLKITFAKNASEVTFGKGVFAGASAFLRIYVPKGDVENYINKLTSEFGFNNGALIYDGETTIPYAQYYFSENSEEEWHRIYKVTTTLKSNNGTITITNKSAQENKTNTFISYSDAFGGDIEGYYREDWKLEVVVKSNIDKGYRLSSFRIGRKQSNGEFKYESIPLDAKYFNALGDTFTYNIAENTRKEDWDIEVDFEFRKQNVTVYMDAGMNTTNVRFTATSSSTSLTFTFSGPTSVTSGEFKGYQSYKAICGYNSSFSISNAKPISSYIIVSFKYREYIYNETTKAYEWSSWQYLTTENFAKISENGYNSLNGYASEKILNDIEFVVQTQYAPFILNISAANEAMGFKYIAASKQYEKIDGVTLVQQGFTSVTIPSYYEDAEQGNTVLYYFLQGNKRFDTGISYAKSEFSETNGYYFLEAQFFTPISSEYYDTSLSGVFKLKKQYSGDGAIPKTIGGVPTTTVRTNLNTSDLKAPTQLFLSSSLILPRTVTKLEEGAFAMSKISKDVYFPTNLTTLEEGSLTTKLSTKFYQTRISNIYAFDINSNSYITTVNGTNLVTANSEITVETIPTEITKLGAYVFAGRSDGVYSDKNNNVVSYGKGVFFDTTVNRFIFSKDSNKVSFDGLLVNLSSRASILVADEGYMTTLQNRGFMSYKQSWYQDTNPYTSMYMTEGDISPLYAIYRNDAWERVYFYTYDFGSKYSFTSDSHNSEFKDNNRVYVAGGVLNYTVKCQISTPTAITRINYYEYLTFDTIDATPYAYVEGSLTESVYDKFYELNLARSTHITMLTTPTEYTINVYFNGKEQGLDSTVLKQVKMTDTFSISATASLDGENRSFSLADGTITIDSKNDMFIISGVPYGSMVSIILTNNYTNSVFCAYSYNSSHSRYVTAANSFDSKTFGFDYAGTRTQSVFNVFEMTRTTYIDTKIAVLPIAINLNNGTGSVPSYSTSTYDDKYTFNISDAADSLKNGNAEFYYFSNDKDALDFTDTRYDVSNSYVRSLSEILSADARRLTLYARYAEFDSSNWTINNGSSLVKYSGTGNSGKFLSSNSENYSTNFVVVPKTIRNTVVKGLQDNAFTSLGSTVSYILLPGGEFVTIGATMFGTSNAVTKIQLPSGISSIAIATFQNASKLTDFILNVSGTSKYSTPNGVLYNRYRTILYAHPRQKEMTSSTILETISTIEEYACYECDLGTAELSLPNVTEIKQRAFQNAGGIKSVTFGNALQTVSEYAFYECPNLQSAQNIANVEDCAFMNCNSLETITFNSNCSTIGVSGFENCSSLISCQFSTSLKSISNRSFYATGLTNANLKDVLYLGVESFANCNDLSSITLSENLTYIPQYCFYNCGLTTLTIPANVTIIDRYSFKNNTSLTVIIFNGAPNSINGSSFENAESIEYIQLKTTFKMCWEGITKWFLYSLNNIKSGVWRYSETKITNNSFVKTKSVFELKDIGFYYFIADNNVSVQVDGDSTLYWYNSLSSAFNSKASGNTSVVTMYADDSIYSELNIDSETNMTLEATDKYVVTIYRGSASTATRNREIFHITGGSMKMGTKNSNLILDGNKDADKLGDNVSSMIYLEEGSFVMNGGKIQNCIADNGGAIYNAAGYIYLKNIVIENCVARKNGGAIYNNYYLNIQDKIILKNNNAQERGGAIANFNALLFFKDGNNSIIKDNSANIDGGGIYLYGDDNTVTLQSTTISNNKAAYGAGVYIRGGITVNFKTGCIISNNSASSLGGGLFSASSKEGSVNFEGVTISYNSSNNGAGIYLEEGTYGNYYSGNISNNTASENGGGIYAASKTKFYTGYDAGSSKLNIQWNKAYRGGGIYIIDAERCYMRTNTTISYNSATQDGGGVYYSYKSELYRSGIGIYCTINSNSANYGGGIYFVGDNVEFMNAGPQIHDITIQYNTANQHGSALFINHTAVVIYGKTNISGEFYAMDRGCLYINYDKDWSNTVRISVLGNKTGAFNGFAITYGSSVIPGEWMQKYVGYFNYKGKYGPTTAWLT